MAKFIISTKLKINEALDTMIDIEKWLKDNPKRKICQTDIFKVRRGYVVKDILKHTDLTSFPIISKKT